MSDQVVAYLARLLNSTVDLNTELNMSSAQMARLHAWLTSQKIKFNEGALSKKMTLSALLQIDASNPTYIPLSSLNSSNDKTNNQHRYFIGIDIQRIDELFSDGMPSDPKSDSELRKIFTMAELSYAQTKNNPSETLTGIFCVKEAVKKAANQPTNFLDIEVIWDKDGGPIVSGYSVSISHSQNYAVGLAIKNSFTDSLVPQIQNEASEKSDALLWHIIPLYFICFLALAFSIYNLLK